MENKSIEELVEEYNANPSDDIFNEIYDRTYKMGMKKMQKLFLYYGVSNQDVEQLIRMATYRAIKSYDRSKAKFSTWIYYYYNDEVFNYGVERNIIRKPDYMLWKSNRARIEEKHPEYYYDLVSLDAPMKTDSDDNTILDAIADESPTPDKIVETSMNREYLLSLVMTLSPRQSKMIIDYFGLEDGHPKTLQMLGDKHHLTRERIRQIIKAGLKRLKGKIHRDDLY